MERERVSTLERYINITQGSLQEGQHEKGGHENLVYHALHKSETLYLKRQYLQLHVTISVPFHFKTHLKEKG